MSIHISGHNVEIIPALSEFINKKFSSITKHFDTIISSRVLLSTNKNLQEAETTIYTPKNEIFAKASSDDMYRAIELLIEKIIRQLEKFKGKLHDRRTSNIYSFSI